MKPLTPRQAEILRYLTEYVLANQSAPTYRETMQHFRFKSLNAVACLLRTLERKGYIQVVTDRGNRSARGIVVKGLLASIPIENHYREMT